MKQLTQESPWYTYAKKVSALFARDPDIFVDDMVYMEEGDIDYAFDITVRRSHDKFLALERLLPRTVQFGNVTLGISLYEEKAASDEEILSLYATLFRGNPIMKEIRTATDLTGGKHGYVCFQPEVIQFYNDDLSDYRGNWSGLAQDIAREVFRDEKGCIHFCTAAVKA